MRASVGDTAHTRAATLLALWDQAEQAQPGKTALIAAGGRFTYHDVGDRIRRLASNLATHWRVRPGDVVALLAPNCPEFVISYFAITRLGAIVQPIDERLSADEAKAILSDSQAPYLIAHHSLWARIEQVLPNLPMQPRVLGIGIDAPGVESFEAWTSHGAIQEQDTVVTPEHIAELMYTSGTTGEPKGVMRSHRNVRAASRNSIRGFGYTKDDVIAISMPMSHSSALNSQMMPLLELGGTLVLLDKFDAVRLIELIRTQGVTCMRAVPTMIRMLLALPDFHAEALPTLRLLINSSAPIDPHTYTELKRRFQSVEVMNSYGLTEASTCTVLPDAQALTHPDSVGTPIEDVEMRVCDEEEREMPDGEEGEIWIRGEHVFVGYRNQPDKTRAVLADGWLRTGDLAHRDAQGLYYLHGRRDDVINVAGRKFAPIEVENCILQLDDVQETAVVEAPHPVLGQVGKAYVVLKEGLAPNPKIITRHCARNLPSHKVPLYVEFLPALPRNSTGKILRRRLGNTTGAQAKEND
jgi:long-chain acyl-CoA synthetase